MALGSGELWRTLWAWFLLKFIPPKPRRKSSLESQSFTAHDCSGIIVGDITTTTDSYNKTTTNNIVYYVKQNKKKSTESPYMRGVPQQFEGFPLEMHQFLQSVLADNEDRDSAGEGHISFPGFCYAPEDRDRAANLLKIDPNPFSNKYRNAYAVNSDTFENISKKQNGHPVLITLKIMSLLSPKHIPKDLLIKLLTLGEKKETMLDALKLLVEYNVVTIQEDHYKLHRNIQDVDAGTDATRENSYLAGSGEALDFNLVLAEVLANFKYYLVSMSAAGKEARVVLKNALKMFDHCYQSNFSREAQEFSLALARQLADNWMHNEAEDILRALSNVERHCRATPLAEVNKLRVYVYVHAYIQV